MKYYFMHYLFSAYNQPFRPSSMIVDRHPFVEIDDINEIENGNKYEAILVNYHEITSEEYNLETQKARVKNNLHSVDSFMNVAIDNDSIDLTYPKGIPVYVNGGNLIGIALLKSSNHKISADFHFHIKGYQGLYPCLIIDHKINHCSMIIMASVAPYGSNIQPITS